MVTGKLVREVGEAIYGLLAAARSSETEREPTFQRS